MRKFSLAVVLQSISPILQFGLAILIARVWGLDVQGFYASKKAFLDLLVVIGSFGFPQSIVLAINRDNASRVQLYRSAWIYGLGLFPFFFVASVLFGGGSSGYMVGAIVLALASSAIVINQILRAVLLTLNDGFRFHLITVVPAIGIVFSVLVVLMVLSFDRTNLSGSMAYAFMLTAGLVVLLTSLAFPPSMVRGFSGVWPSYRRLLTDGIDVFLQATLMSAQSYIALKWTGEAIGLVQAGYVSIGLMLFQAFLLPLQMIAPLLLNQWSRTAPPTVFALKAKVAPGNVLGLAIGFGGIIVAGSWWAPLVFGEKIHIGVPTLQIFMLAALPAVLARFASLYFMAFRRFRINVWLAGLRLGIFTVMLMGLAFLQELTALTVAIIWLFSELVTLIGYWALMNRRAVA